MQLRGVRRLLAVVALALSLPLAGCGALGLGSATPGTSTSTAGPGTPGGSWIVVETGSATPSPTPSMGTTSASPYPSLMGADGGGCPADWSGESTLIPLTVTVGRGSLTVTWPRQRESSYRISAVPQDLVTGTQPEVVWRPVAAGPGCSVTATITGLISGKAYIVWLDAPGAGFQRDGTPNKRSGRSGVVYPG
jgi:hypothetical protein